MNRANFKCVVRDQNLAEWSVEGTVLFEFQEGGESRELIPSGEIRLLCFFRELDGKFLQCESLATMDKRFDRYAERIINRAAKDAFEEVLKPGPVPSDFGMKE
jgi:hypothetical protein